VHALHGLSAIGEFLVFFDRIYWSKLITLASLHWHCWWGSRKVSALSRTERW